METYFNTTNLVGNDLRSAIDKTKSQSVIILQIFKHKKRLTASELWGFYSAIKGHTPITSCRRAITNLKNDGKLAKTIDSKIGMYGAKEYYYSVV